MLNMTDEQMNHVLTILGALVPLMSALSSWINHVIRGKQNKNEPVSPWLLGVGSLLNVLSVNLDKAVQLRKMMSGGAAVTAAAVAALPEEAPAPAPAPVPEKAPVLCAKCAVPAVPTCEKCGSPINP